MKKILYLLMLMILIFTILFMLFIHLFNTSKEDYYPIENYMTCSFKED